MAGVYIHIPFCKKRCSYCDFFSTTSLNKRTEFVDALCKEITLRTDYLTDKKITTIYFGGGTPTLLDIFDLKKIIDSLYFYYDLTELQEITIECNPDDLNEEYLNNLKLLSINRLSIGIQSFNNEELKMLNRRHNAEQAIAAVKLAQSIGFNNISIDLMYGLPYQTAKIWQKNIDTAISLNIQHISAYHLSYEQGTEICKLQNNAVSEDDSLEFFKLLINSLKKANFEQYEISNFAKQNYTSKHNSNYWNNIQYIGFGPGAHSYNTTGRLWNISSLTKYINAINNNKVFNEQEILTEQDKYNELLITALRTKQGININNISTEFRTHFTENISEFIKSGHICSKDNFYFLTEKGIFVSDLITRKLYY